MEGYTRNFLILSGMFGVLGVLAYQHSAYTPEPVQNPVPAETAKVEAPPAVPIEPTEEERIEQALSALGRAEEPETPASIATLFERLETAGIKRLKGKHAERAATLLSAVYRSAAEDEAGLLLKKAAVKAAASYVEGKAVEALIKEALASTDAGVRKEALLAFPILGAKDPAGLTASARALLEGDAFPEAETPERMRRILGKEAAESLTAWCGSARPAAVVRTCVVEMQNLAHWRPEEERPMMLAGMLRRADEAGLLEKRADLPWIHAAQLTQLIRVGTHEDLGPALKVIELKPSLARSSAEALQSRLSDPDVQVRRMVARVIPGASTDEGLGTETGEKLLTGRLEQESDPQVKESLEGSLAKLRSRH